MRLRRLRPRWAAGLGGLLASEGHEIYGLRRNPDSLPDPIRPVASDLYRPMAHETLPENLDYVFYMASAGSSEDTAYRNAYVDGPRNLLEALSSRPTSLRRFFFISSTGVYAQTDGEWVDEDSSTEPESHTGRRLLEGERMVREGSLPATVVRLAGIYGPGRIRSLGRALDVPSEEGPPTYTNRIHRDDCAGALRHLMLLPELASLYLTSDCEPADRRTVARWVSSQIGRPFPEASKLGVRPAGSGRPLTNKRCSNAWLLSTGYEFLYPTFREGFAGLMEEFYSDYQSY